MKKLTFLMVLLLSTSIVFAQTNKKIKKAKKAHTIKIDASKVPQAVKDAQAKQFSSVKIIKWKLKTVKKNNKALKDYIAVFNENGNRVKAHYKPDGTQIAIIHHLPADKVPAGIVSKVNSNYPGFKLKSGVKIQILIKNTVVYRLHLNKPAAKLILYVDESGNDAKKANDAREAIGDRDSDDSGGE